MKNKHLTLRRKAQSFLDYSALIALIIFALLAMSGYVMKSVNARFAHVWADLYHPINGVR
ncbi:MAG: hypothetical protein WC330_02095 [Candidatus Omnitrophota bacterium]|jgi:hypothetical protein